MVNNPFVKFKNLVRDVVGDYKEDLSVAKDERDAAYKNAIDYLKKASVKEHRKILLNGNVVGGIIDIANLSDISFLQDLIVKTEMVRYCSIGVVETKTLINAFDNEKCIGYIKDIYMLISALVTFVGNKFMSISEATQVLGAAIYFNSKKSHKNKGDRNEAIYKKLEKYFNQDGTFKFSEDLAGLYSNLKAMCENDDKFKKFERSFEGYKSLDFALDIAHLYLDFYRDYPINVEKKKATDIVSDFTYSADIRKYYKDGELVSIPDDIEAFLEELKKSHFSDQEIKYILSLIVLAKEKITKNALKTFYSADEITFVNSAANLLENMKPYESNYYEIKEILVELQTLESLYLDNNSEEDQSYILEEKDSYIERLRVLIMPLEEVDLLNIAFLKSSDGSSYFHDDLEKIDKGLRKRVLSLLAKINNDNKKYFRKVFPSQAIDLEIYEVINSDLHVMFTEIPGNIFLIIGVATTGNGYREITNRLVNKENQKNIDDIIEAIKDEDVKKKYLAEQNALIPTLTDKRVRKQIDN